MEQDCAKAVNLFEKAAALGDIDSRVQLGACFYLGECVEENDCEAVRWFEDAIEEDRKYFEEFGEHAIDGQCYAYMGECYLKGFGIPVDVNRGLESLEIGAELRDSTALFLAYPVYTYTH